MTISAGTRLGPYEILAPLGAGGMGEVYRARDRKLDRDVAIKVLPQSVAADPDTLARFEREAKAVAALSHQNILAIHDFGDQDGIAYAVMELLEGETLRGKLDAGPIPQRKAVDYGLQVAKGLSAAHEKGIVHRDLKPENLFVSRDGHLKILDFGLAKRVETVAPGKETSAPTGSGHTEPGAVMGTAGYMSPEQVKGFQVDHRSDIFSFGAILYELLSGRRAFKAATSAETMAAILRDEPAELSESGRSISPALDRIVKHCLEKDRDHRFQSARDIVFNLSEQFTPTATGGSRETAPPISSAGFRVAVLPFKYGGADADLAALADGLSQEIVTGLSRFSYLRVIARSSTSRYANEAVDVRTAGKELGARYVMEGTLRQAGGKLRLAVQVVDAVSGAHLWAENFERAFSPETVFELQDDLVPRIVSTVADMFGVLPRSMSESLRGKADEELSPHEAVLRAFGYMERVTPEEHARVRRILERAVRMAPNQSDAWAMLANLYWEEHAHALNPQPDPLGRALAAARRAVEAAPSNNLAHYALACTLFFQKDFLAFRSAAERALELNRMDSSVAALVGNLIAYAGDWERGIAVVESAMKLNPHHPGWYWFANFNDAYRRRDYRGALGFALKINLPGNFYTHAVTAAAYGQLGMRDAARKALQELLAIRPDFAEAAREEFERWNDPAFVEHMIEGLRKAGLDVPAPAQADAVAKPDAAVAIAVLPFSDMSPGKDQEHLCEGMAEEIMNALVRIDGIRVASRTSAFRARQDGGDLPAIARALSINHVLEGSVRTAANRLRVTAQLTDVASGYQLWSERFDREAIDVFAIQDEIAAGVVEAVKARLGPGAGTVPARPQARNLEAYRSYLKGRHLRGKEDFGGATSAFEEAVRLDPAHAPSWTGLAEITVLSAHMGMIPPRAACTAARKALATAKDLQGESADGLHVEAFAAWIERRWAAMEVAWRRAIEIQPDHVLALGSFAISLCARQRLDEALPLFERAREADPLASFPYTLAGWGLLLSGRPEEGLRQVEDALTFEKEDASAIGASCIANIALGRAEEGIEAGEHGVAVTRRAPFFLGVLGWALAAAGRKDEARKILEELRARPAASPTAVSEAWLLGGLGEIDDAFDVLGRAEEEYQGLVSYTGLPAFDSLRADPRFGALLERLELPSA